MASIKDIKKIQELKGANTIRGEFYLVANRGSAEQVTLGFTTEGTFSVERDYRDANQNQTVSQVKGLKHLDSAKISFETSSLQIDDSLLTKMKGFEKGTFTDFLDGTVYSSYKEKAFVDFGRYMPSLDLMFEFQDGRVGAIRMFNVLETSSDSIQYNRTDDTTIGVTFEAHIDENDDDDYLPYEWLIEDDNDLDIANQALGELTKVPFLVSETTTEAELITEVGIRVNAWLILPENEGYEDIIVNVISVNEDAVGALEGVFFNQIAEITLTKGSATTEAKYIGATID